MNQILLLHSKLHTKPYTRSKRTAYVLYTRRQQSAKRFFQTRYKSQKLLNTFARHKAEQTIFAEQFASTLRLLSSFDPFLAEKTMRRLPPKRKTEKKFNSDLEWFATNPPELNKFRGKFVAIYEQQIMGYGETAVEAERMAKQKKPSCDPAVVYLEEEPAVLYSLV